MKVCPSMTMCQGPDTIIRFSLICSTSRSSWYLIFFFFLMNKPWNRMLLPKFRAVPPFEEMVFVLGIYHWQTASVIKCNKTGGIRNASARPSVTPVLTGKADRQIASFTQRDFTITVTQIKSSQHTHTHTHTHKRRNNWQVYKWTLLQKISTFCYLGDADQEPAAHRTHKWACRQSSVSGKEDSG